MDNHDDSYKIVVLEEKLRWFEKRYGPYIEKRGFSNWRNLIRKPTLNEWVVLFMLAMALFMGWAYNHDISLARETIENLDVICLEINEANQKVAESNSQVSGVEPVNIPDFKFKVDNSTNAEG